MPSLSEAILQLVSTQPGLTDRELTNRLKGTAYPQQPINQKARLLESKGLLVRQRRTVDGLIGSYPPEEHPGTESEIKTVSAEKYDPTTRPKNHDVDALSEDEIKKVLEAWLIARGWAAKIAWGTTQGIDIVAKRNEESWIIEVKGPGSRQPMRVNYFLGILGETLQRMSDPSATYSIALPDLPQYRALWARLPSLAKKRTQITIIFVGKNGHVECLAE